LVTVRLDKSVYSKQTVESVLYRLAGKFSASLGDLGDIWEVFIHPLENGPTADECGHAFRTELIDQSLREQIAAKTDPIKALILSNAFSKTSLIPQDECTSSPA
jgi:His-Xaa-Ser system protein HxsD